MASSLWIAAVHFPEIVFPLFRRQTSGREPVMRFAHFHVRSRESQTTRPCSVPLCRPDTGRSCTAAFLPSAMAWITTLAPHGLTSPPANTPSSRSLAGETVDVQLAVLVHVHIGGPVNLVVHILVDGGDNAVALQVEIRTRDMGGASAAVSAVVRLLSADQIEFRSPCRLAPRNSTGEAMVMIFDALFPGFLDLLGSGRHLLLRSAVNHGHLARIPGGQRSWPRPWPCCRRR